jgi:CubicO group peptidase (beta-lactamase class C family)
MPLLLTFAAAAALAIAPADTSAPRTIADLEARIRRVLDSTHTPGAGLAIVRHDSIIHTGGFGMARVSPARPATAGTLFRIGSTSKMFVGFTALALEREGKLTLQDPLRSRLPGFYFGNRWETSDTLRLVHLLEHTSGFDDNSLKAYANSDPTPLTLAAGLALDSATRVSRWRPGTRFSYCNTGPAIVALVAERIEGKTFEQIVQERWFDRIGMRTATYLYPDTSKVEMATLYLADGVTPVPYWHVFARPAGSINASAHDMAALLRFLLGRGTINGDTLLPQTAIERAERATTWIGVRAGLTDVGYGIHLYRTEDDGDGTVWTGHAGGVEGGISDLSYIPEHGVGYALQINSANGDAIRQIAKLVRGYVTLGLPRPVAAPVAALSPVIGREFSGWYRSVSPRQDIADGLEGIFGLTRISVDGSRVRRSSVLGDTATFLPVDSLRFRAAKGTVATLAFVRDSANGRPQGMEGMDGTSYVRISTVSAVSTITLTVLWLLALLVTALVGVWSAVRWVVRRVRARKHGAAVTAAPAAPVWRVGIGAAALLAVYAASAITGLGRIAALGKATAMSIAVFAAPILYAALILIGIVVMLRARKPATGTKRVSLWLARSVIVLHVVAVVYLARHGMLGWRPWA